MEIVTFEVAQALKKYGFDEICEYAYCVEYDDKPQKNKEPLLLKMETDWAMVRMNNSDLKQYMDDVCEVGDDVTAPTYMQVWLWLWRNKDVRITPPSYPNYQDPEQFIITNINNLVEDQLIKL